MDAPTGAGQSPIQDYALIGDTRTAALTSAAGSIDWLCVPRFDSDPVFGRLVDAATGGSFSIDVGGEVTRRAYQDSAPIIETTWRSPAGEARLTEGMVAEIRRNRLPQMLLVRHLECTTGHVTARIRYDPRRGLPGVVPQRTERRQGSLICSWGALALSLQATPDIALVPGVEAQIQLGAGQSLVLALAMADRSPLVFVASSEALELLRQTGDWWKQWSRDIAPGVRYRDHLVRSLITLRLLHFSPSGAPVAAPTTSLPELLGGSRNWDYRYSWPRDASVAIAAFLAVGKYEEPRAFLRWLIHATRLTRPALRVLYTLYGRDPGSEREDRVVSGYAGSRPVRVGNLAATQHQLDVYGWVVDAVWALHDAGEHIDGPTWRAVSSFVDLVCRRWRDPDAGIWEVRAEPAHYIHSKLWGWIALDRGIRLAQAYNTKPARLQRWQTEREALAAQIRAEGFEAHRGVYTRAYGSAELDSALLLLPLIGFEVPRSPRLSATVEAIRTELGAGGPLVYRYPPGSDGLEGTEGAFLPCSFWLVEALLRLGRVDEAIHEFEDLLALIGNLTLLPEEIDPATGAFLGNYPLALSQAGLVHAILEIDNALKGAGRGQE